MQKKQRLLIWLPILSLLVFSIQSCGLNEEDPGIFVDVEPTFYIDLFETLDQPDRSFGITALSIVDQECKNVSIDYSLELKNGTFILSFNDLIEPAECNLGVAPARVDVVLDPLDNGNYPIEINLKERVINPGVLRIKNDQARLDMESMNGILLRHEWLNRIPKDTYWGYVAHDADVMEDETSSFLTELTNITQQRVLDPGHYGYFTIDEYENIYLSESPNRDEITPLLFGFQDNPQSLIDLLEDYRQNYSPELEIYLINEKGEEF
jgi:hypothetical protein